MSRGQTLALVSELEGSGQDFEWYPTTRRMVDAIIRHISPACDSDEHWRRGEGVRSVLDIGAGDGRVLMQVAEKFEGVKLYSIERSTILQQAQPDVIVPVGAEFHEQNLMALPVEIAFSNPPYSEFEEWAARIITTIHAQSLYLILPQRWETSVMIASALKARNVEAEIIHRDDFYDGERQARAVVHVIHVKFVSRSSRWGREETPDPFDAWFDENIDTFDRDKDVVEPESDAHLARIRGMNTIPLLVEAYNEEHARMEENYRAIFRLDAALLKELGVNKEGVRDGLKTRMTGLKNTYWEALFEKLEVLTSRLTTSTKKSFLERLTGLSARGYERRHSHQNTGHAIAFTESNCYTVVLWAIKAANQYFDAQVVELFKALATHDGVQNYESNDRTWKKDGWRYNTDQHTHFKLDYRIVLHHHSAIHKADAFGAYDYPGNLHTSSHELLDDMIAVFGNLGFPVLAAVASRDRRWSSGGVELFLNASRETVFEVRAYLNGNMHFRIIPDAIKALNIEAARLLGWVKGPEDVAAEMGYSEPDAVKYWGSNRKLGASTFRLLGAMA